MLGYSISFSNFTIIECMSSVKFNIKFIGYLAASQCFDKETEVAVLIVNLVKKVSLIFDCCFYSTTINFISLPLSIERIYYRHQLHQYSQLHQHH